jgi:hypothetical protein
MDANLYATYRNGTENAINTTPFHPLIANLRNEVEGRFHSEFRSVCNSEQISF